MTAQRFPKVDENGHFHVKVRLTLPPDCGPEYAEQIGSWLTDRWLPENHLWRRTWKSGSSESVEELHFDESFLCEPDVHFEAPGTFAVVLHGRSRAAPWRDWLVSKLAPDLRRAFPQIADLQSIENLY